MILYYTISYYTVLLHYTITYDITLRRARHADLGQAAALALGAAREGGGGGAVAGSFINSYYYQ